MLGREQFRLVVPVTEEADPVVDLASLCHRPFVASPAHMSCGRCVVQACREAGFEPVIRHQVDGYPATLRLVAGGAGVALVPDLGLIDVPAGVAVRNLAQTVYRTIELAYRRASVGRPAVRAVIDAVVDAARMAGLKPALDPHGMDYPLVQRWRDRPGSLRSGRGGSAPRARSERGERRQIIDQRLEVMTTAC